MWSTRTSRIAVAAVGLGCGAFVAAPTGAFAAAHHHSAASKHLHGKGFYVADQQKTLKVTSSVAPSALVEDSDGTRHVVTVAKAPSVGGNQGHIVYYTRQHGRHTKWKSHKVPGLRPLDGIQLQEGLSSDGRRVFAVFYQCDGVYAADASLKTTRLPVPTLVQSQNNCSTAQPANLDPPIAQAVPITFTREIGILLPDPSQLGQPAIWTGKPGDTFSPGPALPTANGFAPVQIASDEAGSTIVAVGEGNDGVNKAIYVTKLVANTWSNPKLVATLSSPTTDYTIEGLSTFRRSIFVGLQKPSSATGRPGLFTVHGTKSGQWGGVIRLTHSKPSDTSLRLLTNPDTGHLHAAFTRHAPNKQAGILQETRGDHGWNKPKYYSHSGRDVAQQITISLSGLGVVGYLHT
jgi:hypothetical protein